MNRVFLKNFQLHMLILVENKQLEHLMNITSITKY